MAPRRGIAATTLRHVVLIGDVRSAEPQRRGGLHDHAVRKRPREPIFSRGARQLGPGGAGARTGHQLRRRAWPVPQGWKEGEARSPPPAKHTRRIESQKQPAHASRGCTGIGTRKIASKQTDRKVRSPLERKWKSEERLGEVVRDSGGATAPRCARAARQGKGRWTGADNWPRLLQHPGDITT